MGESFTGLADDASAVYWNPGGLGLVSGYKLALSHQEWMAGVRDEVGHAALSLGPGALGLGLLYTGESGVRYWNPEQQRFEDVTTWAAAAGLGYGLRLSDRYGAGVALKGLCRNLKVETGYGGGVDVGLMGRPFAGLGIGLVARHLGGMVTSNGFALTPMELALGGSYSMSLLHFTLDAVYPVLDGGPSIRAGIEFVPIRQLVLRMGYRTDQAAVLGSAYLSGLTGGIGVSLGGLGIDYALVPYGALGMTHRLGVQYAFGSAAAGPSPRTEEPPWREEPKPDTARSPQRSPVTEDDLLAGIPPGIGNATARAVIVGVSDYKKTRGLPYAGRDVEAVQKYLVQSFGYSASNITRLDNPSLAEMERVFGNAGNPRGQLHKSVARSPGQCDVFVYFVGHGVPSIDGKKRYLLPASASPDLPETGAYPLDVFFSNLARVQYRSLTLVLDVCFSGDAPEPAGQVSTLLSSASPFLAPLAVPELPGDACVLAAGTEAQAACWYPEKGHSLFTYWLFRGLRGEADADENRSLTLGELQKYLADSVPPTARAVYGREQTPVVRGNPGTVILKLR